MNNTTLKFKDILYHILDNGDIGNGWKYVELVDKKGGFSLPKCLYYKGESMKNLLEYSDYINHLDTGKGFINDFVKDIFRECYPGSTNPICKIKENVMMRGGGRNGNENDGDSDSDSEEEAAAPAGARETAPPVKEPATEPAGKPGEDTKAAGKPGEDTKAVEEAAAPAEEEAAAAAEDATKEEQTEKAAAVTKITNTTEKAAAPTAPPTEEGTTSADNAEAPAETCTIDQIINTIKSLSPDVTGDGETFDRILEAVYTVGINKFYPKETTEKQTNENETNLL